jgi:hypothetical protein
MPPLLASSKQKESYKISCKTIYKNHLQKQKNKRKASNELKEKKKKTQALTILGTKSN